MSRPGPVPAQSGRLSPAVSAGYASAEVGLNAVETALRLYTLVYYTDRVGLDPGLAGLATALGLLWDAVLDTVMGVVSDRTRHRFGGRRFWLLPGALVLGLGLLLLFQPPDLEGQDAKFLWLLGAYALLNSGITVLAVPYTAMVNEMTPDPHQRSVLFGWRFAAANLGAVLAVAAPAALVGSDARIVDAMGPTSLGIAATVGVGALVAWWSTRHMPRLDAPPPSGAIVANLVATLANPAFRWLLIAYVVATAGIGINGITALYYYDHRLGLSDGQVQTMLAVFLLTFTISLPVWIGLSKRRGKKMPTVVGAVVLGVATAVVYPLLPEGNFALPLVVGAVGLGFFVGSIALIDSTLTDVIDLDLLHTRTDRAGSYFGMWRFASKLSRASAMWVAGWALAQAGFVPNEAQTEGTKLAIALLFGPVVGAFFLSAGIILWCHRFGPAKQQQVQRLLARRRQGPPA